jgi:phage tail tape-measure protein
MAFNMKYTNGRKASPSSFPFKSAGGVTLPSDSPLEQWDWGSAGGGAATGAKYGAVLGPWGAVGGAIVGGVYGGITGGKANEEAEKARLAEEKKQADLKESEIATSGNTKAKAWRSMINSKEQEQQSEPQQA